MILTAYGVEQGNRNEMSTGSNIAMQHPDGSFSSIFCKADGYPSGVGELLFHHYQDPDKVDSLIALGAISCLGEEIESVDDFFAYSGTVAYCRDFGDGDILISHFPTGTPVDDMCQEEYLYVFMNDGKWYFVDSPFDELTPLDFQVVKMS